MKSGIFSVICIEGKIGENHHHPGYGGYGLQYGRITFGASEHDF